jgi:hypothetical protein
LQEIHNGYISKERGIGDEDEEAIAEYISSDECTLFAIKLFGIEWV